MGLFGVSGCRGLPVDDAFRTVNFTDRIDVRHEITAPGKRSSQFHLKVLVWTSYPNAVILGKPFEQVNALVIESIPGIILRICK